MYRWFQKVPVFSFISAMQIVINSDTRTSYSLLAVQLLTTMFIFIPECIFRVFPSEMNIKKNFLNKKTQMGLALLFSGLTLSNGALSFIDLIFGASDYLCNVWSILVIMLYFLIFIPFLGKAMKEKNINKKCDESDRFK